MRVRALLLLGLAALGIGCAGESKVVRVYDGRIVEGEYVPPEAYAAYLRGVLAEEAGDLRSALSAYEAATNEDDEDPEPLTRIGDLRCRLEPKSKRADDAFGRALRIDPTYAPALTAQARCAALRGEPQKGIAIASRIAPADRRSADISALFVRLAAQTTSSDQQARQRAIALTLANGANPVAWDALIAWGRGQGDGELLARGLEGLVHVAPTRSREIEAGALELVGAGQAALGRHVAGVLADAPPEHGIRRVYDPTVARLAIDDAILAGDLARAERRATRGHVALSEVAARSLILERADFASTLARRVLAADPTAGGAAMVAAALASTSGPDASAMKAVRRKETPTDRPSAACVLVLADRLAALAGAPAARSWVGNTAGGQHLAMAPHDPVTSPLAVDLAARGVIDGATLPLELRVELAARRREQPPAVDAASLEQHVVDAKHALLWHLLVDPTGTPAKTMLSRLSSAADRDPIIAFALVRAALASVGMTRAVGSPTWAPVLRALASSPSHPLLLAVAVEIAQKGGRAEDVPPARARLMAVARTPAERALATE